MSKKSELVNIIEGYKGKQESFASKVNEILKN